MTLVPASSMNWFKNDVYIRLVELDAWKNMLSLLALIVCCVRFHSCGALAIYNN